MGCCCGKSCQKSKSKLSSTKKGGQQQSNSHNLHGHGGTSTAHSLHHHWAATQKTNAALHSPRTTPRPVPNSKKSEKHHIPNDYLGRDYYQGALIDIGSIVSYHDLVLREDLSSPGWVREKRGGLAYNILMERSLGESLIENILEIPTTARLPEDCSGSLFRTTFRGYDVVGIRLVHKKNDRKVLDSCVRKLKAAGPREFRATMVYYGRDPARRTINAKKKKRQTEPIDIDIVMERE